MAVDKKVTGLNLVTSAEALDLLYLVVTDETDDTISLSKAISVQDILKRVVQNINRIISGSVVWTGTGYVFKSINLFYELNGEIFFSNDEDITLIAPDGSNPRLDVIYVDKDGLQQENGTPAPSPAEPSLTDPENQIKTNLVLVQNGTTEPPDITLTTVYKENLGISGGEADATENTSGARIDLANTVSPLVGAKDIKNTSRANTGDRIDFDFDTSNLNISDLNNIRMKIKSLRNWRRDFAQMILLQDGSIKAYRNITAGDWDTTDTTTIQDLFIHKDDFVIFDDTATFNEISLTFFRRNQISGQSNIQIQLDEIIIQNGNDDTVPDPVTDEKVKVSENDTLTGHLIDKLSSDANITLIEQNDGGNETLKIGVTGLATEEEVWIIAFSDETTALTAGTNLVEFQMPNFATTLLEVAVTLGTAGTTSTITFDLNEGGTSVLSTKITIDATEKTSETAATPAVISDSALAANAVMTVDLDTLDSGGTSAGGKLIMYWKKA